MKQGAAGGSWLRLTGAVRVRVRVLADIAASVLAAVCPVVRQGEKAAVLVPAEIVPAHIVRHHVAKVQGPDLLRAQNHALHFGHKARLLGQSLVR